MRRVVSAIVAGTLTAGVGLAAVAAPAASATTAARPAAGSTFDVVAGSFTNPANALRQVKKLNDKGFPGFTIMQVKVRGKTFNRVLRSFSSRTDANGLAAQLKAAAIASWINRR